MSRTRVIIIVLFTAAAFLRLADAFRPIDHASWRECDEGAISRNFVLEGMNPLMPRIDWRGTSPGYAEMEFPVYPYLTALSYQIFGIHDEAGRLWSFLFSVGALFFFYRLAREYLSEYAAIAAFAFFAVNPLMVETSTSIQPEGVMIFAYIAAVYFFVRWIRTDKSSSFRAATAMTALTLLAKAPAAHIGLFFGILLLQKYGWTVFRRLKVWMFAFLTLVPAVLWYVHAKGLWTTYGNSLGVSNEDHWVRSDFFTDHEFITGILRSELLYVWVVFGVVAGVFAVRRGWREEPVRHSLLWFACIFAFYVAAARTTAEDWASYYHIFSIPPAALLFGFAVTKLRDYVREFGDSFSRRSLAANLTRLAIFVFVAGSMAMTFLLAAKQVRADLRQHRVPDTAYTCAAAIKPALKKDGLIVTSGGHCHDKNGYPRAYNASFMFYWLDRKGWNDCIEDQSVDSIEAFAQAGAVHFVAQRSMLDQKAGFENDLRRRYPVIAECEEFLVFDLTDRTSTFAGLMN